MGALASATPAANKVPIADGTGKLADGWLSSAAITAGTAEGKTEAEVDAAISALCDADTARLKNASDEDFRQFTEESGKIIKSFLARI